MAPARKDKKKRELPPDFPTHKACPDCYAEGRDPYILPIDQFHIKFVSDPRYKSGVRLSTFCKEHESVRRKKRYADGEGALVKIKRETGVAPPELVALRAHKRSLPKRKIVKTRAQKLKQAAQARAWYANHKERAKANHAKWVAEHPEQRKATQDAWYEANKERLQAERQRRSTRFGRPRGRPRSSGRAATAEAASAPVEAAPEA